jgi:hypothetical protein
LAVKHRLPPRLRARQPSFVVTDLDRYTVADDSAGLDRCHRNQRNGYDYGILMTAVVLDASLLGAISDAN